MKPSSASIASQDTLNNEGYKAKLHESHKDSMVSRQSSQALTVEDMHHKVGIEPDSQNLKDSVMTNSRCYPATTYANQPLKESMAETIPFQLSQGVDSNIRRLEGRPLKR